MSKCRQCNIEVLDETQRCPLCGSVLEPTVEVENMYPNIRLKSRKLVFISRLYLFCAIAVEIFLINLLTQIFRDSESNNLKVCKLGKRLYINSNKHKCYSCYTEFYSLPKRV